MSHPIHSCVIIGSGPHLASKNTPMALGVQIKHYDAVCFLGGTNDEQETTIFPEKWFLPRNESLLRLYSARLR